MTDWWTQNPQNRQEERPRSGTPKERRPRPKSKGRNQDGANPQPGPPGGQKGQGGEALPSFPWIPGTGTKGAPGFNPFAAISPSPFSHPGGKGYHAAFGMPPPWTPVESGAASSTSNMPQEHRDLLAAVKSSFPDLHKMPPAIREALDKTSASSSKQLTTDLHKAATALGRARKNVQELQVAKLKHRSLWAAHLQEALNAWQQQIQSYNAQQEDYAQKLCKAQADLQAANDWIQELNVQAKALDVKPLEESEELNILQEPTDLQPERIQEQLKMKLEECVRLTGNAEPTIDLTEDSDKVANKMENERKRARSADPAPEHGAPVGDAAMSHGS